MNREDLVKLTSNINKNSCPKNINFHCHTKFSDGSLEPYELLEQAYKNNLKFLSITDHHTIKAHEYIKKNNIIFLKGCIIFFSKNTRPRVFLFLKKKYHFSSKHIFLQTPPKF